MEWFWNCPTSSLFVGKYTPCVCYLRPIIIFDVVNYVEQPISALHSSLRVFVGPYRNVANNVERVFEGCSTLAGL